MEDVTELKRVQAVLQRSEALLAEAQQLAHIGSWSWDLLSDEIKWSDEHYRIVGLAPQAMPMTGEHGLRLVHPDDLAAVRAAVRAALREAQRTGEPYELTLRIVRADGALRAAHSRGPKTLEGRPRLPASISFCRMRQWLGGVVTAPLAPADFGGHRA